MSVFDDGRDGDFSYFGQILGEFKALRLTTVERKTSTWPTFSQLDGDEPDMEGVCETCDDHHEVKEGCYFYCIGDNRCCMKVITPYCGDCKWRRRKQIAQQGTSNEHNT